MKDKDMQHPSNSVTRYSSHDHFSNKQSWTDRFGVMFLDPQLHTVMMLTRHRSGVEDCVPMRPQNLRLRQSALLHPDDIEVSIGEKVVKFSHAACHVQASGFICTLLGSSTARDSRCNVDARNQESDIPLRLRVLISSSCGVSSIIVFVVSLTLFVFCGQSAHPSCLFPRLATSHMSKCCSILHSAVRLEAQEEGLVPSIQEVIEQQPLCRQYCFPTCVWRLMTEYSPPIRASHCSARLLCETPWM